MRIDIISDVACPWCAVGLNALEQALARVSPAPTLEWHFQPFELNPDLGPEGVPARAYLQRKYGLSDAQLDANRARIAERGAEVGFAFGERAHVWNTFQAHRLMAWAENHGPHAPRRLKHALLQAYHGQGRNPSDAAVLRDCAQQAGLDGEAAAAFLAGTDLTDRVRQAEHHWRDEQGIHAVPAFVFDGQHLLQGAQPVSVFEQVLRRLAG
jgi:predicted DsbA family dithiol-disulfide isomerase